MRRAHSVRNHTNGKSSFQLATDDMGALTEGDERPEDGLRKKLLEKDRENDKVCVSWVSLVSRCHRTVCRCSCVHRFRRCRFSSPSGRLWRPSRSCRKSIRIWSCSCKGLSERTRDAWGTLSGEALTWERRSCDEWSLIRLVLSSRSKMQVKHLEQALTDLAGPNWKVFLVDLVCPWTPV